MNLRETPDRNCGLPTIFGWFEQQNCYGAQRRGAGFTGVGEAVNLRDTPDRKAAVYQRFSVGLNNKIVTVHSGAALVLLVRE